MLIVLKTTVEVILIDMLLIGLTRIIIYLLMLLELFIFHSLFPVFFSIFLLTQVHFSLQIVLNERTSKMSDTAGDGSSNNSRPRGWLVLKHHVLTHKIDVLLWATRVATMVFTVGYILPLMGNPYNSYYKAELQRRFFEGMMG